MNEDLWDDNERPFAYLITFRTFGTWLHGDARHSVDRHGKNTYGTPKIEPNQDLVQKMRENSSQGEFRLDARCRDIVERAIKNVCLFRYYRLFAVNVRTNHAHTVVSAAVRPETVLNSFKANATRELREEGLITPGQKVWSRGGSTRYLWKPSHLEGAVDYVLYGQGDDLPNF